LPGNPPKCFVLRRKSEIFLKGAMPQSPSATAHQQTHPHWTVITGYEATSQYWNLKIPLEKRVHHSVVDIFGRNALKLTCEHLWIQKFFRGLLLGSPLKGEDRGQEGRGVKGGERAGKGRVGDGRAEKGMVHIAS
jgi:hypothetical protein